MIHLVERILVTTDGRIIWPQGDLMLPISDVVFYNDLGETIQIASVLWIWSDGHAESRWLNTGFTIPTDESIVLRVLTPST